MLLAAQSWLFFMEVGSLVGDFLCLPSFVRYNSRSAKRLLSVLNTS